MADRKTFDEILDSLKRLGRTEMIQRLLPRIEKSRLVADLARNELAQCSDVIALYHWKGGTNVPEGTPLDDVHFFPGFYWLSWDDAMTNLSVFKKDSRWKPHWLPVFANGGGDFYVVDCEQGSESLCAVVGFVLGEPEQDIEYESLGSMLQTILECYGRGAFFVTIVGTLKSITIFTLRSPEPTTQACRFGRHWRRQRIHGRPG